MMLLTTPLLGPGGGIQTLRPTQTITEQRSLRQLTHERRGQMKVNKGEFTSEYCTEFLVGFPVHLRPRGPEAIR
jgi:hypothetical protein